MAASSFAFCTVVACLCLLSSANLMGVDLGLSYIKVAIARPGKGLELVTNEQSKRKTPAAVGFTDEGERLFGDAAVAYAAKAPSRAILDGRSLIGQCAPDDTVSNPDGSPFCKRKLLNLEGVGQFTGEEVIAMQLAMARRQASAALGGAQVKDVAVTVPAWFDERQRQAVADAARITGLNCLGVVNANTAAALKYALDGKAKPTDEHIAAEKAKDKKKRTPKTVTQNVMFYDVGAGSATASIAQITSDVKTGVASGVKMLSHSWEKGIAGRLLDSVIVDRLADAFDEQRGAGATPSRDIPRVMMRLRKEGQRVREVLSANTNRMVSVASLHDDLDLRTTVNRADFEKDAKSMFELVGNPAKAALAEAKLTSADLDAVVPFGGASRTPYIQDQLCKTLGIESLNKSINSDEAAVMGSVFFAASLSSTFRVRKLDFEDVYMRSISADIEKDGSSGGMFSGKGKKPSQRVEIFPHGVAKMPSKKTLSLNRDSDFSLEVYLGLDKSGKSRFPEHSLYSKINVKGVAKVLKKLKDSSKAKNLTPRVALTFRVDRSGLISIGTAESSVDETVVVEREVEIKEETPKKDAKDKKNKTADSSADKNEGEDREDSEKSKETEAGNEDGAESSGKGTNDSSGDENEKKDKKKKKKTKIEKSTQTIVHRQTLTIEYAEDEGIMGMQMSGKQLEAAKKVLKDLESADVERAERADALNALEGFILEVRSKVRGVDEDDDLYKVSTEEEREGLVTAFDEAEDWMYTEDAKQTANLRKKHFELQKIYEPMEIRAVEIVARPEALKTLTATTELSIEKVSELKKLHESRKSTHMKSFEKFDAFCESVKKWVSDMEVAQSAKALTEEPAVSSKEVMKKMEKLSEEVNKVIRLPVPPAPKVIKDGPKEGMSGGVKDGKEDTANATGADQATNKDKVLGEDGNIPTAPEADAATADATGGSAAKDEL